MEVADELGYHIDAGSTALTMGTNLFGNFLPDAPNTAVSITEYSGGPPTRVMGASNPAWENPRVQVISRSTSPQTAKANARLVWNLLEGVVNQTVGGSSGSYYLRIECLQSPFLMKRDPQYRSVFAFNVDVERSI